MIIKIFKIANSFSDQKCYFPQLCPTFQNLIPLQASKQKSLLLYNDTEISNFYRITFDIKDWYGPHLFFKLIEKHPEYFSDISPILSACDDHNCFYHTTKTCENSNIYRLLKGTIGKKSIFTTYTLEYQ